MQFGRRFLDLSPVGFQLLCAECAAVVVVANNDKLGFLIWLSTNKMQTLVIFKTRCIVFILKHNFRKERLFFFFCYISFVRNF